MAMVVEDSISESGARLTTLQLRYQRFVHAEFMTHRVFSRNASSSRAIPVSKMIEQVRSDLAMPRHWGKNQTGMQSREELQGQDRENAIERWRIAAAGAARHAELMANIGVHKQVVNRILEPFVFISVIVTATEWSNFFELRDHEDAQPEIRTLTEEMRKAIDESAPVERPRRRLETCAWHLPYITQAERDAWPDDPITLARASAARCARVSYLTHDGARPQMEQDLALYERLVGARPLHASPVEHQAYPMPLPTQWDRNFLGWRQHRSLVELEHRIKS